MRINLITVALKFCSFLFVFAAVLALQSRTATAQQVVHPTDTGFSFAVYGDSRSMFYLPYKSDQEAEARQLMVQMFELVFPKKTAEAVVERDVKFIYDPATHELAQVVMPFDTKYEVTTLTLDKGWVTKASVEDVKLLPGVHRTMFELPGGEWVAHEVAKRSRADTQSSFSTRGTWSGGVSQGSTPFDNPYWKLVNDDVVKELPAPDDQMRAAGLGGRFFAAVGNHEVWEDPNAEGFLSTFPYLKQLGVSDKQLVYKFDYNGARFIFLWTGKYDENKPTAWGATRPTYEEQMKLLAQWLDEAKAAGIRKVFVSFHNPVFCRSGMGPIPEAQSPHKLLASYAKDLDIVVFNGHVHTTEIYQCRWREVPAAGRRRRRTGPDSPGPGEHQDVGGLSAESIYQGQSPQRGVQLPSRRC